MKRNTGWGLFPFGKFSSLVDQVFGELDKMDDMLSLAGQPASFDNLFAKTNYPYNVYVTSDNGVTYDVLEVALAGVDKDRLSVKIYNEPLAPYLEVSVKKPEKQEGQENEGKKYSVKRTTEKSFYLTLVLANHDLDQLSAELKNGMLTVSVPRVGPKPKEVVVKEVKLQ